MQDAPARGRVRAKTGFIDGTSALSGVAHALVGPHARVLDPGRVPVGLDGLNSSCWKPMQDEICLRLVAAAP